MLKFNYQKIFKLLSLLLIINLVLLTFKYLNLFILLDKLIKSLTPILLSLIISFLNEPLIIKLEKVFKRKIAVFMIYLIELGLIIMIAFLFLPSLINKLKEFSSNLPLIISNLDLNIKDITSKVKLNNDIEKNLIEIIVNYFMYLINFLTNSLSLISSFFIGFVTSLFLSLDYLKFKNSLKNFLIEKKKTKIVNFLKIYIPYIYKYIFTLIIDIFLLFIISFVSFLIIGLEHPFLFSFIIAIFDIIPLFGPIIGGAPAFIYASIKSFKFGLLTLTIIVLSQFIEANITRPLLMKSHFKIHPLEGLIALSVLGVILKLFGIIISPLVVIALKIIFLEKNQ